MANQAKTTKYIDIKHNDETIRYITEAGIKQDFGLKDNGKITSIIHYLAKDYDYQNNDYFKDIDCPISINIKNKKGIILNNSMKYKIGKNKQTVQGILYDIWEYYYAQVLYDVEIVNGEAQQIKQDTDKRVEDIINHFKDLKISIGTNRDMVKALLPILDKQTEEIKQANNKYYELLDSIVVRLRTKSEQKISNPFLLTASDKQNAKAQLDAKIKDYPYLTDETGEQYQAFKDWLDADPKHKPILPD